MTTVELGDDTARVVTDILEQVYYELAKDGALRFDDLKRTVVQVVIQDKDEDSVWIAYKNILRAFLDREKYKEEVAKQNEEPRDIAG